MAISYYATHSSPSPHTYSRASRTRTLAFVLAVLSLLNVGLVVKRHDRVVSWVQGLPVSVQEGSGQLWRVFSWRGLDYPEKLPLLTEDGEPGLAEMIVEETVHFNPLLPNRDQTWHVMRSLSNGYFRSPSPPDTLTPAQQPLRPLPHQAWNQSAIDPMHPDFDPLDALGLGEDEEGKEGKLARGKNRMFITTMFHEVHCLRVFSAVLAGVPERGHLLHCTDYMRDGILCGADMTLEPEDWLVRSSPPHDRPSESPDEVYEATNGVPVRTGFESRPFTSPSYISSRSSTRYMCRNWETAYEFLDENFAGGGGWNETRYEWMIGDPGLKVKSAPGHHH